MYKTDTGLDKGELIKRELSLIGTNGRRAGIILIWDAQSYDAVIEPIRTNTKYLFVGRMNSDEEVKGIKRDWGASKEVIEWILHFNTEPEKGIFEFAALTSDKFILYNPRDGSIQVTTEPQRGRLITPMAQQKQSGKSIETVLGLKPDVGMRVELLKPKTITQKINELIQ